MHLVNLNALAASVTQSHSMVTERLGTFIDTARQFQNSVPLHADIIRQLMTNSDEEICEPLLRLRESIRSRLLPTRASPQLPDSNLASHPHCPSSNREKKAEVPSGSNTEDRVPLAPLVNKRPREQDTNGRPGAANMDRKGRPIIISEDPITQAYFKEAFDENHEPRIKRRHL
ncbi:hypothetical protein PHISCL_07499 [Aspergillus sclerotialis]|uniref:Uncharacterized protein n=1 Tax=Aspergillus sclerotialis TaxID=2070753 RepID=A0A3A2ZCZ8_9EURO|nr:hypothetical protein PHISCL_07499 [Aspergillus sclerotialis]